MSPGRRLAIGASVASAVLVLTVAVIAARTRPVRRAVTAFTELLAAANVQDIPGVRRHCTARYLASHSVEPSPEGGVVGLPRNMHPNFQAWRQGPHVWICPTNRIGPIYQFAEEGDSWKFDGPAGLLLPRNQILLDPSLAGAEVEHPPP